MLVSVSSQLDVSLHLLSLYVKRCLSFNWQASVQATLGKSTQDWEILVHGKSQMVLGRSRAMNQEK